MQVFATPEELWKSLGEQSVDNPLPEWYSTAVNYWDGQAASDDGVLGGYGELTGPDLRDSKIFLEKVFGPYLKTAVSEGRELVAIDCGAGVGRVSEGLLLQFFHQVDLLEPSAHLLSAARTRLLKPGKKSFPHTNRAVGFFQAGLETFNPEPGRYDAIWIQWALLYVTDDDAISLLKRCRKALKAGGMIFIKENVCAEGFIVDRDDASVTRSHAYYVQLIEKSGLILKSTALQKGFPKDLYKVRMYAVT